VEGNCVQWIGGADVFGTCPGITEADSGGLGGAGTKLLGADLGATQAGDVGVVLNLSETGQDLTVTLTAMTLIFYNAAGAQVGQFFLDPSLVGSTYTSGEGTGLGGSGFVFHLDAAQAAAANLLNATRVGGGFMVTGFNDGQETMYVFNIPTGGTPVPEPASLLLFGTGLAGVGRMLRRRMKNQRAA
jgi:hypothetical protein